MSRSTRTASALRALGWLALLVAAVALIVWQLQHPTSPKVDADDQPGAPLLALPYADWAAVEGLHRGERVRFERDAAGAWFRHDSVAGEVNGHAHPIDTAAAERIASVLQTFSRARVERTLSVDDNRLSRYGLGNPALILLIHDAAGRVRQTLEFGDVLPDGLSRYLHLPQTRQALTVANFHAVALMALMAPAPDVRPP